MNFIQWIILIQLACLLHASKKITVYDLDTIEVENLRKGNQSNILFGLDPIYFDLDIMKIAQHEADRFASHSQLMVPIFKTNLNYVCFMYKIVSVNGKQWVGQKAWFTNIKPMKKIDLVDIAKNYVDYKDIDMNQIYAVGYGRTADVNGDIFFIRIYLSRQKRMLTNIKSTTTKKHFLIDEDDEDNDDYDENYDYNYDNDNDDKTKGKKTTNTPQVSESPRDKLIKSLMKEKNKTT